jgi:hypothetical protein
MSITVAATVICLEVTPGAVPWGHFVTAALVAMAAAFTFAGAALVAGTAQQPARTTMLVAKVNPTIHCLAGRQLRCVVAFDEIMLVLLA